MTTRPKCPTCGRKMPGRGRLTEKERAARARDRRAYRRGYQHGRAGHEPREKGAQYRAGHAAGARFPG